MTIQGRLPLAPRHAIAVSDRLSVERSDGFVTFFNGADVIATCREGDALTLRATEAQIALSGLASPTALARAVGVDPSTVFRNAQRVRDGGVGALMRKHRTGPRGPHKLVGDIREQAQKLLDQGWSVVRVAETVGVVHGTIQYAISKGWLRKIPARRRSSGRPAVGSVGPTQRDLEDQSSRGGVAVKRTEERVLARLGKLDEAKPEFQSSEAVANAGVLVALGCVLHQGLLDAGKTVYRALSNGFFGLQSVLLTMVFMALLRIRTAEELSRKAPGELGLLLGLDRTPEAKTLRRKLAEMGARELAADFSATLTKKWAQADPDALGFLYVDGHVRPYHGEAHRLGKTFVQRRRMCMPAATDYWVNDAHADPLFFVTAPDNDGLLATLERSVLPEVRTLVGDRRVTLIFDREGWSPKSFEHWCREAKFDVVTYRKGKYDPWPETWFVEETIVGWEGPVSYLLAEKPLEIRPGFVVREIRRLCDDGHQTSIVTTRQDLDRGDLALKMFSRWRQENFFRYMRAEFAIDHLPVRAAEDPEPSRDVPNPKLREKARELRKARAEFKRQAAKYGEEVALSDASVRDREVPLSATNEMRGLREQMERLKGEIKLLPKRVSEVEALESSGIVRLERERKRITDAIKMVAYRSETELAQLVSLFARSHSEDGRRFLRELFTLTGDLIPDENGETLTVKLHGMANPRSNAIVARLCEFLNTEPVVFPGTRLRLLLVPPQRATLAREN